MIFAQLTEFHMVTIYIKFLILEDAECIPSVCDRVWVCMIHVCMHVCVCVCVCVRTHVPIIVCPCLWEETAFSPVVNFLVFVEFFYIFILLRVFKKRIWENNPLYNVSVDFWKLNAGLFFVFVFVFSKNCKEMEWLRIHTPIWNTCVSNNNK